MPLTAIAWHRPLNESHIHTVNNNKVQSTEMYKIYVIFKETENSQ